MQRIKQGHLWFTGCCTPGKGGEGCINIALYVHCTIHTLQESKEKCRLNWYKGVTVLLYTAGLGLLKVNWIVHAKVSHIHWACCRIWTLQSMYQWNKIKKRVAVTTKHVRSKEENKSDMPVAKLKPISTCLSALRKFVVVRLFSEIEQRDSKFYIANALIDRSSRRIFDFVFEQH